MFQTIVVGFDISKLRIKNTTSSNDTNTLVDVIYCPKMPELKSTQRIERGKTLSVTVRGYRDCFYILPIINTMHHRLFIC